MWCETCGLDSSGSDMDQWRAVVDTIMKLQVREKADGKFPGKLSYYKLVKEDCNLWVK